MRIEIYIPSNRQNGRPLLKELRDPWLFAATELFCTLFGGCTTIQGMGFWRDKSELHSEPVTVIYALTNRQNATMHMVEVRDYARKICGGLDQQAVMVSFDGDPEFVT